MSSPFNQQDDEAISSINITPFVDIILVVLIIFMLTTPVIMNPGIQVNLPRAASGESTEPSQLNLSIAASGDLFINGEKSTLEGIADSVKAILAENQNAQAIIAADQEVSHGKVITVLDQVKAAGITRFAISIKKE